MNQPIKNSHGEELDYSFEEGTGKNHKSDWLIILGHGVTGNKDRPVIHDTASALNNAGFDTLRFSFAGNGDSQGQFEEATISKEVSDLKAVLDVCSPAYSHLAYIGHSMGGAVGVLSAAKDDRIKALVSLAGMVDTKTFAQTEFGNETPDHGLMWDDEDCPLSSAFMTDLCETIQSVAPQAKKVKCPWLLLHGTGDDVVRPQDTEAIQNLKGSAVETLFIPDADHSFSENAHKKAATEAVVSWFQRQI